MQLLARLLLPCLALLPHVRSQPQRAAPPRAREPEAVEVDPLQDCFQVPRSLCFRGAGGGSFVVGPSHAPGDLAVWYRFDSRLAVDDSGRGRHLVDGSGALAPVPVGPGLLGRGGSAALDGRTLRQVRGAASLEGTAFSVSLWIYLREDSVGGWRTIFGKGEEAGELLPALLLRPDERRLQVRASPAGAGGADLDGAGLLPLRRWTHVAVTCSAGGALRLYVNGVKDGEVVVDGPRVVSSGELYVGRDPWRAGVKAYLDDFRWYTRALSTDEIQAMLYPSLTGMAGAFVRLGCASCRFAEAVRGCGERAHVCSLQELFAGGFHAARAMGWLAPAMEVWYDGEEDASRFSGTSKLGLCCND